MHRCGCAVLTFVCPSGSPHTHWSAALRLIGHCDQKYQAFILLVNTQLCRVVILSNVVRIYFFLPLDLARHYDQKYQAFILLVNT